MNYTARSVFKLYVASDWLPSSVYSAIEAALLPLRENTYIISMGLKFDVACTIVLKSPIKLRASRSHLLCGL